MKRLSKSVRRGASRLGVSPFPKPWNTALPQGRSPEADQGIFLQSSDGPAFAGLFFVAGQYTEFEGLSTAFGNETVGIIYEFLSQGRKTD